MARQATGVGVGSGEGVFVCVCVWELAFMCYVCVRVAGCEAQEAERWFVGIVFL